MRPIGPLSSHDARWRAGCDTQCRGPRDWCVGRLTKRATHLKRILTAIPDVILLEPAVFTDARGWFFETFRQQDLPAHAFVQDSHSRSVRGVLRGLHYQIRQPQGKLVRAVVGEVFDVAVDLRRSSPTFGQWVGARLSAENRLQMWVPPGFAHGLLAMSDAAEVVYKATDYYAPEHERALLWSDAHLAIAWPLGGVAPILTPRDAAAPGLAEADLFD